jgi:hypothetical protein
MPKHAVESISVTKTKKGMHVMSPIEEIGVTFPPPPPPSFFSTRALFTFEFLQLGQKRISIVIWKYWQGYIRLFIREDLNSGLMLGSCIMTMPLLMTRCLGVFGQKIDNEIGPSTIFTRFLLAIPKTEDRFEGPQSFRHCRHSGTCDDHPAEHSRRGVPETF